MVIRIGAENTLNHGVNFHSCNDHTTYSLVWRSNPCNFLCCQAHRFGIQFYLNFQCPLPGGSARWIACNLMNQNQVYEKHKNENFSYSTFTTGFKICLYARHFDSSVCQHEIFGWHFADSSKLLKSYLIAENLNEVKSSSLKKQFFKSSEKSAKYRQKIPYGQTDESKHLAYRHILKPVVKVHEEKFSFLCFFSLPAIRHADPPCLHVTHMQTNPWATSHMVKLLLPDIL